MTKNELRLARIERLRKVIVEHGWPETFFRSEIPQLKHLPAAETLRDLWTLGYRPLNNPDHPSGWANSRNKIEPKYSRLPVQGETKDNQRHD